MNPRLSPQDVAAFRAAYEQDFGKPLSLEEAEEMANRVVDFTFFVAELLERRKAKTTTEFESPVVSSGIAPTVQSDSA